MYSTCLVKQKLMLKHAKLGWSNFNTAFWRFTEPLLIINFCIDNLFNDL